MTGEASGAPLSGRRSALDAELGQIRTQLMQVGQLVATAMEKAVWGLREQSPDLCTAVIEGDAEVNEHHRAIRELCHTTILIQQPVARDLRHVLSYERMSSELERMGDHCVSIARIARSLCDLPDDPSSEGLGVLAGECRKQLVDILDAVETADIEAAREVAERDAVVDQAVSTQLQLVRAEHGRHHRVGVAGDRTTCLSRTTSRGSAIGSPTSPRT